MRVWCSNALVWSHLIDGARNIANSWLVHGNTWHHLCFNWVHFKAVRNTNTGFSHWKEMFGSWWTPITQNLFSWPESVFLSHLNLRYIFYCGYSDDCYTPGGSRYRRGFDRTDQNQTRILPAWRQLRIFSPTVKAIRWDEGLLRGRRTVWNALFLPFQQSVKTRS